MVQSKLLATASLILLSFAGNTHAQTMDYSVVATLNESLYTSMSVIVDDVAYQLESNSTYPVIFSGQAPVSKTGYRYAKTGNNTSEQLLESFLRLPDANQSTPHEFFNRTWNKHPNVLLPQVYSASSPTNRLVSLLHKDDEIPTIHFTVNQTAVDIMHQSPMADPAPVSTTLSYISLNEAFQFNDVELGLAGRSSTMMAKLSYILKLKKKDSLYGYRRIKLRSLSFDPSYLREQIGYDILSSAGVASTQFSYVRVFMNSRELGLFGLIEAFQDPWVANEFADGDTSYKNGYLYQGTGAVPAPGYMSDLAYYQNNLTAYTGGQYKVKAEAKGESKDNFQPLMDFTRMIAEAPVNTSDSVAVWNKFMDTEGYLRSMAIEILAGYADGYIANANNFYIYQNPETNQNVYIPADLDLCLGNSLANITVMANGNYADRVNWGQRPLLKKILLVKEFNDRFIALLQDLNTKLFDMSVVGPRIDSLQSMLQEDVAWDKTLPGVAQASFEAMLQNLPASSESNPYLADQADRFRNIPSFDEAVNDLNYNHLTAMSLKQWFTNIYQNTATFFSQASATK